MSKATEQSYSSEEQTRLARHEAAHFVVAWAVGSMIYRITIYPTARQCRNDPTTGIQAETSSPVNCSPFQHVLIDLAGPVADCLGQDNGHVLKHQKVWIDKAMESITSGAPLHADDGDWDKALRILCEVGFDITDPAQFQKGVCFYLDAVRAILTLCQAQWQETTEYLIANERIGYAREPYPTEAEVLMSRWEDDEGDTPQKVRECVAKYRSQAECLVFED